MRPIPKPPSKLRAMPQPATAAKVFRSPYGVNALICRKELLIAYKDKAEADAYAKRFFPGMDKKSEWKCESCGYLHRVHYPLEISGQSSGKSSRKDAKH